MVAYDPGKSKDYKDTVYSIALQHRPATPIAGAVSLTIRVFRATPKAFSKKKVLEAEAGLILPTTKPDAENYAKGATDALTGIMWVDDSQIVSLHVSKMFSSSPRMEFEISEVIAG